MRIMKMSPKRAVIVLVALILSINLVSCSKAPSSSEEIKLIEYEKCIQLGIQFYNRVESSRTEKKNSYFPNDPEITDFLYNSGTFKEILDACKDYRP
jgi:hypothetical protein